VTKCKMEPTVTGAVNFGEGSF